MGLWPTHRYENRVEPEARGDFRRSSRQPTKCSLTSRSGIKLRALPPHSLYEFSIEASCMILHPKSKIVALRALLAVTWAEERRLLTIINSEQASTEEISKALKDLHKLWSQIVLQLADIEDATVMSTQIALHPIDR